MRRMPDLGKESEFTIGCVALIDLHADAILIKVSWCDFVYFLFCGKMASRECRVARRMLHMSDVVWPGCP